MRLLVRSRSVLDAARHEDELPWASVGDTIPKLHAKPSFKDQEHLFGVAMDVPGKNPLHLDQLDFLSVQPSRDLGPPMLMQLGEPLLKIDDVHGTSLQGLVYHARAAWP